MYQAALSQSVRQILALALFLPFAGYAQEETGPVTTLQQEEIEEIIVTGTRIPEPNLVSASPIQVIDEEAIKISGRTDLSDALQLLPQMFNNSLGQGLGNRTSGLTTPGGVSNLDLRGLGPNRTLVMVNGRRLGAGSPNTSIQSPAPNPDQIPVGLVERTEVLTGGASSVYGSDAIAGVVNFILKRDFEGLEIDGTYGVNWHDNDNGFAQQIARDFGVEPETGTETDGGRRDFYVLGGVNSSDGRGNFTVYLGYQDQDPVASGDRDFGACQLFKDTDDAGVPTGTVSCGGSANSNFFSPTDQLNPFANNLYGVLGNQFVDWGSVETNPPAEYNSQELIYMSREFERYNAGFLGHFDINDNVKPYVEFTFSNDQTHQEIAPTALFISSNTLTATGDYFINCSNPLLSDQQRAILCSPQQIADDIATPGTASSQVAIGRRNVEGGARSSDFDHSNYRAVLGATGDIGNAWTYDAYGQYYYTDFYSSNNQYFDFAKITNALQVTTDPETGAPVCVSGGSCVPYNIFADGGVTPEALAYLYTTGTSAGTTKLGTFHVDFTGDLGEYGLVVPTAEDGVGFNIGWEKRHERVDFAPDEAQLSGLLSGFGGAAVAIDEGVDVEEWFAETRVPLIQGRQGIEDLTLGAAYRHSQYTTTGGTDTYKFEVKYAPVDGFQLRGSVNKAIRAPSLVELYNPVLVGKIQVGTDPCAWTEGNTVAPVRSLEECLNTVSPDQAAAFTAAYNSPGAIQQGTAGQLSQLQGGNEDLDPEQAKTYTIGLTLTPALVEGFTGSIDYYRIDLENIVDVLPASVALNLCPVTGDPVYCSLLSRNPINFTLDGPSVEAGGYIIQTNQNIAESQASGIDLQLSYDLELDDLGSLNFVLAGTYMIDLETTDYPGSIPYDCTGLFGLTCQTVNPEWRHIFRTTWDMPWDSSVSLTWRYMDDVNQDNNDDNPTLRFASYAGIDTFNDHIASFSYWDLAGTYNVLDNVQLRAGVNNMFDTDPPYVSSEIISGGAPNTYEVYDIFGRQLFVGFNVKL